MSRAAALAVVRGIFTGSGRSLAAGGVLQLGVVVVTVFLAKLASTAAVRSTPVWLARHTSTHSTSAISSARFSFSPFLNDWSP